MSFPGTFLANNNAATTLGSLLSSVATTLAVATGTGAGFPQPGVGQWFALSLFQAGTTSDSPTEIVYVTSVTGDTFTVVRGQEGTTPQAWPVGSLAQNLMTAGQVESLVQAATLQVQPGNFGFDVGTANAGVVVLSQVPVSLASMTGAPIRVKKIGSANTGAYTLTINTGGGNVTAPVVLPGGSALVSGALPAGAVFSVVYDGTSSFVLQSGPGASGLPAATAAQIWAANSNVVAVTPAGLAAAAVGQALTDASTVNWNWSAGYNASLLLTSAVGATRLIALPTNMVPWWTYLFSITQSASGNNGASWASGWDFLLSGPPTLSTAGNIRDLVSGYYDPIKGVLVAVFQPG